MKKATACTFAVAVALGLTQPELAQADPTLRFQVDQHGDFALIGNTLGQDCANGVPAPLVGTVGACGSNVSDSSPDVFWRADSPGAGQATADTSITNADARSTAVLGLPAGASITYARLYWAAAAPNADVSVTLERPGVFTAPLTADDAATVPDANGVKYQATADVTALIQAWGEGAYRLGGVSSHPFLNVNDSERFAAWSLVVLYDDPSQPLRQLSVFDGLDLASSGTGVPATISGFLIPNAGIDAKLGVIAYLGDGQTAGDTLTFNGMDLVDGVAATNNFFNSSRTRLGTAVSTPGDLPRLTGGLRSLSGVDLDIVDVTTLVMPGSTSATVVAKAGGDNNLLLGGYVTSITTYKPDFNQSTKTATDVNGGALLAGDVVEYTIHVVNTGNDTAIDTILEDVIPTGTTYVPGSIQITSGPNVGAKTDATGDDQGEFDGGIDTVRVRLGTGADAVNGGSLEIGETTDVVFQVTVDQGTTGTIDNLAIISAAGQNGAPVGTFASGGGTATTVPVDECEDDNQCASPTPACLDLSPPDSNVCVECIDDSDCSGTTPVCDTSTNTCGPCASDADCTNPALPACQTSGNQAGACTECSATNDTLCTGADPICLTNLGSCGCTDVDGDSECGGPNSGVICNGPAGSCVPGCSTAQDRNDCPTDQFCSAQDGSVGQCISQPCVDDNDCSLPLPFCDTSGTENVCVECLQTSDCSSPLLCDNNTCVECTPQDTGNCDINGDGDACLQNGTCGCVTDSDCGAIDSAKVCDATSTCIIGCRGPGFGNGCPSPLVCTSTTAAIGQCVVPDECQMDSDCAPATPVCDVNVSPKICVECVDDSDCAGATPICDLTTQTCGPCQSDDDCTNPLLPACQLFGNLQGSCGECSVSNDSLCGGDAPICLTDVAVCGCTDVDGDAECGGPNSGIVCSGPVGTCIPGCVVAPDHNDCPEEEYCSDQSGLSIGMCLPHDCVTDDDCTEAPNLVCDTEPLPHTCVECVESADCPSGQVCETDGKTCVECTPDDTSNCDPSGKGAACLETFECGCNDDDDCASDKECDTDLHECVDGEPGTGGGGMGGSGTSVGGSDGTGGAGGDGASNGADNGILAEGGCGCSTPGQSDEPDDGRLALLFGALGAVVLRRRRRPE